MSISALQSGIAGLQNGLDNMRRDAAEIARAGTTDATTPTDITRSLVNLRADQRQVEASARVVKASDEILGTLLDELA